MRSDPLGHDDVRARFAQRYRRELRTRALGVRLTAILAAYAVDIDRPTLRAEALAGLRRVIT